MADETSASAMVNCYAGCMAQLRGRAVYVQFSNHRELKTDQTHSNAVSDTRSFFVYVVFVLLKGVFDDCFNCPVLHFYPFNFIMCYFCKQLKPKRPFVL